MHTAPAAIRTLITHQPACLQQLRGRVFGPTARLHRTTPAGRLQLARSLVKCLIWRPQCVIDWWLFVHHELSKNILLIMEGGMWKLINQI